MWPQALGFGVLALCLALVSAQQKCYDEGTFERGDFPYCKELSDEYAMHWKVQDGYITYGVAVAGKYQMIGLGISDSGGMRGADMAILTKEESITAGTAWQIGDYWSTEFVTPTEDTQQDAQLVSYSGTATTTLAQFKRPLDTGDRSQDIKIQYDTDQLVVFAYGDSLEYHGPNRGWQVLRLWPANYNTTLNITGLANSSAVNWGNSTEYTYRMALIAQDPPDLTEMTLALPNVPVAANPGVTHKCVASQLPSDAKYHIIRYEGLPRSSVSPSPVMSMRLYGCTSQPSQLLPYDCGGVPDKACNIPLGFWGKGMKASMLLPPEAGIPFGNGTTLATFAMLVVQFNNTGPGTMKDSSGFALHYTAQLRPYDMGILQLGGAPPAALDPGNTTLTLPDVCPSSCTSRLQYNVTLVTNYLSMDQYGQAIITRHVGSNTATAPASSTNISRVEVQPLGSKSYWWMGWQSFVQVLPRNRALAPGDTLATQCNATQGYVGRCVNWLHYYPAVPGWTSCGSLPAPTLQLPRPVPLAACPIKQTYPVNWTLPVGPNNITTLTLTPEMAALATTLQAAYTALTTVNGTSVLPTTDVSQLAVLSAQALSQLAGLPTLLSSLATVLQTPNGQATVPASQITSVSNVTALVPGLNAAISAWTLGGFATLWKSLALNDTLVFSAIAPTNVSGLTIASMLPNLIQAAANATNGAAALINITVWTSALDSVTINQFIAQLQADALLQVLPVSVITAADTVFTPYVEPYQPPPPPLPPVYFTSHAVAGILAVTIGLSGVLAYLWVNHARKEDPERQALLAALQQTILEEAANHPDLSEEELKDKLQDQVRKRLQAEGIISR